MGGLVPVLAGTLLLHQDKHKAPHLPPHLPLVPTPLSLPFAKKRTPPVREQAFAFDDTDVLQYPHSFASNIRSMLMIVCNHCFYVLTWNQQQDQPNRRCGLLEYVLY